MTFKSVLSCGAAACCFIATSAIAQDQVADPDTDAALDDATIVVTAVARGQNVLDSSITVSSLDAGDTLDLAPRSSAELLRQLPGIRSESSGGEGNANISVRGLPVASGGAKFLQLQEDSLPILEFGDITFGNADIFLRTDYNIERVESVRGGSASTFASNSPGGVVNFISKTGTREGGNVGATVGLDYDEYRVDFDYGAGISDDLYFHVGGFYRGGEGPRAVGYDGYKGGQLKANITKEFDRGYVRFYGKYLDDRSVAYLPNPVRVTGSDNDPDYENVANFDINEDSLHSRYFTTATSLDGGNSPEQFDIRDGMRPLVKSVGLEAEVELGGGWTVTERFRFSDIGGEFISPFPGGIVDAQSAAESIGGDDAQLLYATGPNADQIIGDPSGLNGNGLVANIVLFNVQLNSLDNVTNDIRISNDFDFGEATATFTAGFYNSRQTVDTDWLWTSHLLEVRGDGRAALLDVRGDDGIDDNDDDDGRNLLTQNGTVGFGATFFGNCCRRSYDLDYSTNAPFASVGVEFGDFGIDGSLRYDFGSAEGTVTGADLGGGRVGVTSFDFDNDGDIDAAEAQTSVLPLTNPAPVDYDYDYVSYSLGVNYRIQPDMSVFARYSRGGRANADRLLFNASNVSPVDGSLTDSSIAVDFVKQAELGVKYRSGGLAVYATGFYAETEEQNFEATTQRVFNREYEAKGLEVEGSYAFGNGFSLSASGTYTDSEIKRDSISPDNEGNTPRRQADFIYQATAKYDAEMFGLGANIVGTTDSFAQDSNQLVLPGFAQVNAFVNVRPIENLEVALNANNLFNVSGFTEAEEGSIPGNNIVRARSINGRTVSASVRVSF